jgi:hypothetical protein
MAQRPRKYSGDMSFFSVALSSSQEDELSYEYGKAGAFTVSYIDTIKRPLTWNALMDSVIQKLKVELGLQTPELSTGQPENLDTIFEI